MGWEERRRSRVLKRLGLLQHGNRQKIASYKRGGFKTSQVSNIHLVVDTNDQVAISRYSLPEITPW